MGLFTRRKTAAATFTWWPDEAGAQEWPVSVTADDGCAGGSAFGVRFILPAQPAASVTVWVYAAHGPEGTFMVGWRYEYAFAARTPWTYSGWDGAPQLFATVEDAERAALATAVDLASAPRTAHLSQRELFGFFDWDGVPWVSEVSA